MKKLAVYTDFVNTTEILSDAEIGRLFRAMLRYASSGSEPNLSGNERFLWGTAKADIDRQRESYETICHINRANASHRSAPNRSESQQSAPNRSESQQEKKRKEKKIKKEIVIETRTPTDVSEVIAYYKTLDTVVPVSECEKFYDHFSSNGWKVSGKAPMKDWKAAFRNWIRNVDSFKPSRKGIVNYQQHQQTDSDLDHLLVNLDG